MDTENLYIYIAKKKQKNKLNNYKMAITIYVGASIIMTLQNSNVNLIATLRTVASSGNVHFTDKQQPATIYWI